MPPRTLSEDEFNTVKQRVLSSLPSGLSEQDFNQMVGPALDQALKDAENSPPSSTAPPTAPTPQTWADRLGLNTPTPPGTPWQAGLKGAAAGAVDLLQGAKAGAMSTVFGAADLGNWINRQTGGPDVQIDPAKRAALTASPQTFSGQVGRGVETLGELALPVGEVADAIPSATRAGQTFQDVMGAAKNVPIDLGGVGGLGDIVLRTKDLADRGGKLPKAVNDFLKYATDPSKPAMTYEVARDFASNISRLSRGELGELNPVMLRQVGDIKAALNLANAKAAQAVGKGAEYGQAMREYAQAMGLRQFADTVIKKYGIPATGVAAGGWALNKLAHGAYNSLFGE